jgi:hypothetical protein
METRIIGRDGKVYVVKEDNTYKLEEVAKNEEHWLNADYREEAKKDYSWIVPVVGAVIGVIILIYR